MPRVQEKASGIFPSRSISRGSRISTITTPSSEASLMASAALMVSISVLASSISALMPRWMVWGICFSLLRHSGASRSDELWSAVAHPRISILKTNVEIPDQPASRPVRNDACLLPHQFLHRAFEALDRDRIHALREDATDDGGRFRIVPMLLRHRVEPHRVRI